MMVKNKKRVHSSGFTLLEALLALSVVSVGIMAAFTLALANLNTAKQNYNRILAVNLAREGVEIIRNVRDSNWLEIEANYDCDDSTPAVIDVCAWDQGLNINTSKVAYNNTEPIDLGADVVIEDCFDDTSCRLYQDVDGYYDHVVSDNTTNMARIIKIVALCLRPDPDSRISTGGFDCEGSPSKKVGLRVTAEVYWVSGHQSHTIEIVEDIYNWRAYVD